MRIRVVGRTYARGISKHFRFSRLYFFLNFLKFFSSVSQLRFARYIYYRYVCGPNIFLNRTLAIDSPLQNIAVGLLVKFIDQLYHCFLQKRFPRRVNIFLYNANLAQLVRMDDTQMHW